jgi:galactokinase
LVDSEYNTRRAECAEAARLLGLKSLRDASLNDVKKLSGAIGQRARHVISENDRVKRAVEACKQNDRGHLGDLATLGRLMDESHSSLRDDYAVSCAELDAMVEIAQKQTGCYGARLTGAGFGGCTVNLVDECAVPGFVEKVAAEYTARVRIAPEIFVCRASEGAG